MATRNDITGDELRSKTNTKAYEDNWDLIFGKKKKDDNKVVNVDTPTDKPLDKSENEQV